MGIQWVSNGYPMDIHWVSNGYPMGIQWVSNGYPMGIQWISTGYPMGIQWVSSVSLKMEDQSIPSSSLMILFFTAKHIFFERKNNCFLRPEDLEKICLIFETSEICPGSLGNPLESRIYSHAGGIGHSFCVSNFGDFPTRSAFCRSHGPHNYSAGTPKTRVRRSPQT